MSIPRSSSADTSQSLPCGGGWCTVTPDSADRRRRPGSSRATSSRICIMAGASILVLVVVEDFDDRVVLAFLGREQSEPAARFLEECDQFLEAGDLDEPLEF